MARLPSSVLVQISELYISVNSSRLHAIRAQSILATLTQEHKEEEDTRIDEQILASAQFDFYAWFNFMAMIFKLITDKLD
jgi:hypothetical protein